MKKGRHRRYEEARKFRRDSAASFDIEDYDFEANDDFEGILGSDEESEKEDSAQDDHYLDLAKKYDPDADLIAELDDDQLEEDLEGDSAATSEENVSEESAR